jgi:hypothetical protein
MGNEGDILYFDPFYFKYGNSSKPKYFIILKITGETSVIASLPSSKDFLPANIVKKHGCVEIPEACFNCYVFESGCLVTTNGWSFPLDTYVYGQQIDEYEISILKDIYPVEGLDFKIIGNLTSKEFSLLKACFINSANVKRKYKKMLSA